MNRDPKGNPDCTGEYPKVPPPPPTMPAREGPEVPDPEPEERSPIAWRERLVEVALAAGILVALVLLGWAFLRYVGVGR